MLTFLRTSFARSPEFFFKFQVYNFVALVDLVNAAPKNVANILKEMGTSENHLETSENTEKKKGTLLWTSARRKRSTNSQRQNGIQKCHSGRVYVNLANFQNVIAPSGFYTHYCGETYSLPIGNSTIVQTLSRAFVEAYKTVTTIPQEVLANPSCCVPKKFHSLYILHLEEDGVTTLKPIPNIKASRCVCKKRT